MLKRESNDKAEVHPTLNRLVLLMLCIALLLGAYLRMHGISDYNFVGEEENSLDIVSESWADMTEFVWTQDNHPPLYYWLLKAVFQLTDYNIFSGRYISASAGILAIPAMAVLISLRGGRVRALKRGSVISVILSGMDGVAVTAAFVTAILPSLVVFSRLGRMFICASTAGIFSWIFLEYRKKLPYFISIFIALMFDYTAAAIPVAQILWLILKRDKRLRGKIIRPVSVLSIFFIFFLFSGASPTSEDSGRIMIYAPEKYTLRTITGMAVAGWTGREPLFGEWEEYPWTIILMAVSLIFIFLRRHLEDSRIALSGLVWFLTPLAGGIAGSAIASILYPGAGLLQAKIIIVGAPGLALMAAALADGTQRVSKAGYALIIGAFVFSAIPVLDLHYNVHTTGEAIKIAKMIQANYDDNDRVIFSTCSDFAIYISYSDRSYIKKVNSQNNPEFPMTIMGRVEGIEYLKLQRAMVTPFNAIPENIEEDMWSEVAETRTEMLREDLNKYLEGGKRIWLVSPNIILDRSDIMTREFLNDHFNVQEIWHGSEYDLIQYNNGNDVNEEYISKEYEDHSGIKTNDSSETENQFSSELLLPVKLHNILRIIGTVILLSLFLILAISER